MRLARGVPILLAYALLGGMPVPQTVATLNHRPLASSGMNRTIGVPAGNASATTNLDASGSSDADGDSLSFSWSDANSNTIGTTAIVTVTIPLNSPQVFVVTVKDTHGATDTATVTITAVADQTAPIVEPPFDIGLGTTEALGARGQDSPELANFLTGGTAGDTLDPSPIRLSPQINGVDVDNATLFPFGTTTVTFRFQDHSGNIGTADAQVTVADLHDGDLFVGGAAAVDFTFGTLTEPGIYLIRNGATTKYCDSGFPGQVPFEAMMDREGRILFFNVPTSNGNWVMFRCAGPGKPLETIAQFATGSTLLPDIPEAFPGQRFTGSAEAGAGVLTGLHLEVENVAAIDGSGGQVKKRESYVFSLATRSLDPSGKRIRKILAYSPDDNSWSEVPGIPPEITTNGSGPVSAFHSGTHYWAAGQSLFRSKTPLTIRASGKIGGTDFDLSLGLFGGAGLVTGLIEDDIQVTDIDGGCDPNLHPGITPLMPLNPNGTFSVMDGLKELAFDEYSGENLVFGTNQGANIGGLMGQVDELPFDDPSNDANFFMNPFLACKPVEKLKLKKLLGFSASGETPPNCCYNINHLIGTPMGLVSKDFARGQIQRIAVGTNKNLPVVATLGYLPDKGGLTVWPVKASPGATAAVVIRVDSPVDVLATDPNGKRIGMDTGTGQQVNDFGQDGFDSGPGEPRFFAIQNPAPGNFQLQSVGTGVGPFTIHVYHVSSEHEIIRHIAVTGTAEIGVAERHDFSLDAAGELQFMNPDQAPTAIAGSDQVLTADASRQATVALDGSQSSDPDGDPLSYQWAGPFGLALGAAPHVSLPVGEHAILLTVDDGRGKNATAKVVITVLPPAANVNDVTSSVSIVYGAFRYNAATRRFIQVVTITNTASTAIQGPLSLVLDNLNSGVSLYGATATTTATTPAGSPYLDLNAGADNRLMPGESASLTLQFDDPTRSAISYSSRVLAGIGTR
jgi:hypothetical protein